MLGVPESGEMGVGEMSPTDLTREERDALLRRLRQDDDRLRRPAELSDTEYALVKERFYSGLAEYFDRLPRVPMSACPFCGQVLRRAFDPYGLDGYFWHVDLQCEVEEPAACEHYKVHLGALSTRGREPAEVFDAVKPGPEVPFVVPALLSDLPGMVAVVAEMRLETGDVAWPVAYFTDSPEVKPWNLHQPWLRDDFWFTLPSGEVGWSSANEPWDFELAPYAAAGKLRWTDLAAAMPVVHAETAGRRCPFVGLPGDRRPQILARGRRSFLPLPDGAPDCPFGEGE